MGLTGKKESQRARESAALPSSEIAVHLRQRNKFAAFCLAGLGRRTASHTVLVRRLCGWCRRLRRAKDGILNVGLQSRDIGLVHAHAGLQERWEHGGVAHWNILNVTIVIPHHPQLVRKREGGSLVAHAEEASTAIRADFAVHARDRIEDRQAVSERLSFAFQRFELGSGVRGLGVTDVLRRFTAGQLCFSELSCQLCVRLLEGDDLGAELILNSIVGVELELQLRDSLAKLLDQVRLSSISGLVSANGFLQEELWLGLPQVLEFFEHLFRRGLVALDIILLDRHEVDFLEGAYLVKRAAAFTLDLLETAHRPRRSIQKS
mmetsp:Transcript_14704/g.46879  ORF Transcript_14704/g.46879 Transcript_14704/m.46879 type:complete len:320 (+) Transcript_14704:361-1320(+)